MLVVTKSLGRLASRKLNRCSPAQMNWVFVSHYKSFTWHPSVPTMWIPSGQICFACQRSSFACCPQLPGKESRHVRSVPYPSIRQRDQNYNFTELRCSHSALPVHAKLTPWRTWNGHQNLIMKHAACCMRFGRHESLQRHFMHVLYWGDRWEA